MYNRVILSFIVIISLTYGGYVMKKSKALICVLAMVFSLCFMLAGCKGDGNYPVTVGHTEFKEAPDKVVSLSDNIADIICYMGYSTKLSGRSDACTQPELKEYVTSVGSELSPNTDLIISSNAKVVLTDSTLDEAAKTALEDKGITVIKMLYPQTEAQLKSLYASIGAILGGNNDGREKGSSAYDRLMSILNSARDEVSTVASTKTLCYLYVDSRDRLCAYTGTADDGLVLNYLGVTNIAANFESGYVDENLLKLSNPDYIFFDSSAVMEKLTSSSTLQNLSAIRKGNVYELKKEELNRQGESLINVQAFMLSSMFPNFVDAPVVKSEDLSSAYGITLTEDMNFKAGDDNENIICIQKRLVDLGYLDLEGDEPTTYFGTMSEEALMAFQSNNSLEPSGVAGFETLKRLFDSNALGASGSTFIPETTANATEPASEEDTTNAEGETTAPESDSPAVSYDAPFAISDSTVYQSGDDHEDIKAIQERLVDLLYLSFDEGDSPTTYYGPGTETAILNFQESNGLSATGIADAETLKVLFSDDAKIPQ